MVIHWLIFPYPPGLLHWHCGNLTIAPVPAKQPWWIWINTSCEFIMNDCITTTKQSTTKPCAYFLGYTVYINFIIVIWLWNKKEMSPLDATLSRVSLTLTFVLDLWPWIFKLKLYLGNGRPDFHGAKGTGVDRMPWSETLRKWVNWVLRWLGTFDLDLWRWIFKVKLHLGNGRPDCHGTEETVVDRTPWCETLRKWVNRTLRWLGYLWPLLLTLNFQGQIVSREWKAWLPWNERGGCKTQPLCDLEAEDTVRDRGDLGCRPFHRLV